MKQKKVDILGTTYTIRFDLDYKKHKSLDSSHGLCDYYLKQIKLVKCSCENADNKNDKKNILDRHQKHVLRHEIIHAFLHESGLYEQSNKADNWSQNEEMVDWFAIQFPKIQKVYKKLKVEE